jgi:quercetin dioxygenase-like cupin family protein
MDTSTIPAIVRAEGDGERRWFYGGGHHTWKVRAAETNGAYFLFEDRMEQGKMTPLHTHPEADETMYVLEGELLVHLDGREHRVAAGGTVMAPRGLPHAFMVLSPVARMLCLHTPGSCEAFYWGASEPDGGDGGAKSVDFARIRASAGEHGGIELLGPPPFAAS